MTVEAAISLLLALIQNASQISALIQAAQAKGETTLGPEVWTQILAAGDTSRAALVAAIASAQAKPAAAPPPSSPPI